uniref:GPALPP motifs-containing protein 1 n=1 Tax=Lepisosteus oculatus TaxID=7918 RepID=W5ME80_LEPOC|nr:PREDICTED: GPALPP motifs-containing protein 1 [Lepisosteus oculatus]
MSVMSDDIIGPALPPGFQDNRKSDSEEEVAGPALPPGYRPRDSSSSSEDSEPEDAGFKRGRLSGHAQPPGGMTQDDTDDDCKPSKMRRTQGTEKRMEEEEDGFFGPALPPGYQKPQDSPERPVIGPALPPGFKRPADDDEDDDDSQDGPSPAMPPGCSATASSSEEEEGGVIGPLPPKRPVESTVAMEFERRAQKMKEKLISGGNDDPKELARETWMTELPPELQHFGLGPRTFKKRSGPECKDRSLWTDTPADKERKARERLEGKRSPEKEEIPQLSERDQEMAEKVSKYNDSKRSESLLNMHTKKLKRKTEEEVTKPQERRPFDRDQDLQVNRFDQAQKKALIKKSQELNTRFSHSKGTMFL